MPPRLPGSRLAQVLDRESLLDVEAAPARARDELQIGLDAAHRDAELGEQLHELAATEAEVDHRIAADELLRELGVARAQVVAAAAEERGEVVLAVPGVDRAAGNALAGLRDLVLEAVHLAHLLGEPDLEIVELLQHLRVELVADRRRDLAEQRDRVRDEPALLLDLRQHAVDLAAQRARHRAVHQAAAGQAARRIDPRPREPDLVELAQRRLELVVQRRRRPRPHADEPVEVLVERRLEIVGVLAATRRCLDPSLQLGDHGVEVDGVARSGRVSRIRRHGVNLAEAVRRDRARASVPNLAPMANDRLPDSLRTLPRRSPSGPIGPLPYEIERAEIEAAARDRRAPDFPTDYVDRVHEQVGAVRAAHRRARRHPGRDRAARGADQRAGARADRLPQPRRRRGQEGRAQGRVLHGQPPDRADARARAGRRPRSGTPRPSASSSSRPACTSSRPGSRDSSRRRPRTRRSRDRGPPVPLDVRRPGRDRDAHAPAAQAAARRGLRVRHLRGRHARRRARAGARPERRSATACTRQRRRVDPVPLLDRQPALRSRARARRSARARLPQHHRREVLLALGAARRDDACSKGAASSRSPRRRSGSRSPTPQFNERELIELGCPRTAVAPILIDFADYDTAARRRPARRAPSAPARAAAPTGSSVGRDRTEQVPARRAARVRGLPPRPRPARPAHARRRPERRALLAGAAPARRGSRHRRRGHVHRRRQPRGAARVLPHLRRVRAALGARGLQRARARGDALRRAGRRVRRRRRCPTRSATAGCSSPTRTRSSWRPRSSAYARTHRCAELSSTRAGSGSSTSRSRAPGPNCSTRCTTLMKETALSLEP